MAIIKRTTLISPSADTRTLSELNVIDIESGVYYCNEGCTINGVTSSLWTVVCISNNDMQNLHCYTQIWIPSTTGSTSRASQVMFVRTSSTESTGYSSFSSTVVAGSNVKLEVSSSQPTLSENGETKLWIQYPSS